MSERDDDRARPIAKGYVDDVGRILLVLMLIIVLFASLIESFQVSKIRDLQRRVGRLEQQVQR